MNAAVGFAVGMLFGVGLLVSGMANPANVQNFLDVTGTWDPRLAFVMMGAILVAAPAFAWMRRNQRTLGGEPVALPDRLAITPRLLAGAAIFGVGWGLAGVCPGPALVQLGEGYGYAVAMMLAMAVGLVLAGRYPTAESARPPGDGPAAGVPIAESARATSGSAPRSP